MPTIKTSSIILLAETDNPNRYIFGIYKDNIGGASIIGRCLEQKLLDEIKWTLMDDYFQKVPI